MSRWEVIRADIENVAKSGNIPASEFRRLGIHEDWKSIEDKIYKTFCEMDYYERKFVWLWEYFKLDNYVISVEMPYLYLDRLIDEDELVWFFVNGDYDKFWYYEGKIRSIMTIIGESSYIDELYVASKKYKWLICINHHDALIATGDIMPERLRQLEIELQKNGTTGSNK